jgi:hypothetical protein
MPTPLKIKYPEVKECLVSKSECLCVKCEINVMGFGDTITPECKIKACDGIAQRDSGKYTLGKIKCKAPVHKCFSYEKCKTWSDLL